MDDKLADPDHKTFLFLLRSAWMNYYGGERRKGGAKRKERKRASTVCKREDGGTRRLNSMRKFAGALRRERERGS